MRPPPVYPQSWPCQAIWKESFWRSDFSTQISSKPPSPQETEHGKKRKSIEKREKKEKKEEEKEKLQVSLQIKGNSIFWEEKNTLISKILFDAIPFSPPPSYHFKNPFQNHWESFLNSFWTIL
jgi:hypothetical protein